MESCHRQTEDEHTLLRIIEFCSQQVHDPLEWLYQCVQVFPFFLSSSESVLRCFVATSDSYRGLFIVPALKFFRLCISALYDVTAPHTPRFSPMLILMSHSRGGAHLFRWIKRESEVSPSYLIAKANHEERLIYQFGTFIRLIASDERYALKNAET